MSDQSVTGMDSLNELSPALKTWDRSAFLWSLAQPVLVLGFVKIAATMVTDEWMNHKLYALIISLLLILLLIDAERICSKRDNCSLSRRAWPKMLSDLLPAGYFGHH